MFHINLVNILYKILELFCYCDLELDPMTLISELDLDILVTYVHAKNEVNRSNSSEVIIWTAYVHRQTDVSETFTFPLLRAIKRYDIYCIKFRKFESVIGCRKMFSLNFLAHIGI